VHHHDHEHRLEGDRRALTIALALVASIMAAEIAAGVVGHSLALLADAGHMLTDVAALALALSAVWFGSRPATPNKTFGY
jgi:cobalt-zinc-cadmium efflux system protein